MQAREFYTSNIQKGKIEISRLKKVLFQFSMLRLAIFLAIIGFSYLFRNSIGSVALIIASGITLFLLFVSKFTDAKNQREYFKRYVLINEIELKVLKGDISGLKTGKQFIFENHYYNQDIDLFDEGSLFQHICRSETASGERILANWLNSNDIQNIETKQAVVQELASKADWRQHYQITASLIDKNAAASSSSKALKKERSIDWIKKYERFVPYFLSVCPLRLFSPFNSLDYHLFLGLTRRQISFLLVSIRVSNYREICKENYSII